MATLRVRLRPVMAFGHALILGTVLLPVEALHAQQPEPLRPGEAYVTRFSGTGSGPGGPAIDVNGIVGSIIDVRSPGQPPQGQHWVDEPQRNPVTAGQVGQVFGVALDDANPPNVYLAATSAFGLHRTPDNAQWMPGMWGQGGGPGTIYRLDAASGYAPRIFTQTAGGRPNSGPALGNLAHDRFNKQLFVSDLESGLIHRIRLADGGDLGAYDHGAQGRPQFLDVEAGQPGSLPPIGFDPNSRPRIANCPDRFDQSPECWNFAASGRRVWGLGVHRNPARNEVRLYYSVWSGPAFNSDTWNQQQEDDKRNSVWSVRLGPDGGFAGDVRREFIVPDFFAKPEDIARSGYSQPVSDISFAACGPRPVMLIAERGGIRNLGLAEENPFAYPHEARALRYELDQGGAWRAIGRYDVGFYDRQNEGPPFIHANCSGGIAFGPGYDANRWVADPGKPDQFVWITGHSLCSPAGPCNLPGAQAAQAPAPGPGPGAQPAAGQGQESPLDESQVHGAQGLAETAFEEVVPATANEPPSQQAQSSSPGLNQSYLIDTDINVDPRGGMIERELTRNDATKIGDIAIYQLCEAPAVYAPAFLLAPPPVVVVGYHYRRGSHSRDWSHFRYRSHNPYWSHSRRESHHRWISHWRWASHDRRLSHRRYVSHERYRSHWRVRSHERVRSHFRTGTHERLRSHFRTGTHRTPASRPVVTHSTAISLRATHKIKDSRPPVVKGIKKGTHDARRTHLSTGSHNLRVSHARTGSHSTAASRGVTPKGLPKITPKSTPKITPKSTPKVTPLGGPRHDRATSRMIR